MQHCAGCCVQHLQSPLLTHLGMQFTDLLLHSGARVALCELPFSLVQTDTEGGLGGTCILRGCVPKKLLVYGGEYANEFRECEGYGCETPISASFMLLYSPPPRLLRPHMHPPVAAAWHMHAGVGVSAACHMPQSWNAMHYHASCIFELIYRSTNVCIA